jgi:hypothetical protein
MKRLLPTTIAFAIGVSLVLVASGGSGIATPQAPVITDISFDEGVCSDDGAHCKTVDGRSTTFGSRMIFTIPLKDAGTETKIGYEQGECVFLHKKSNKYYCTYVVHLDGGGVSVQGTLPYSDPLVGKVPVTGGTGIYEGASGYLKMLKGFFARYRLHVVVGV